VSPLLSNVIAVRAFPEPPDRLLLAAVSVVVSLPPGKARLRRPLAALYESVLAYRRPVCS
jgi:hypothetical protein